MAEAKRLEVDAPFELWSVDLSVDPEPQDIALLSTGEQERARRFRFSRDRRRYVIAHASLRRLLMARGAPSVENSAFAANEFGKPSLDEIEGPGFSISYAGDMALIGISRNHDVGVDIEVRRVIHDEDITGDVFDSSERVALVGECAGAARGVAFLRAWTRKEACVKAIGTGLSIPPSTVVVGTGGDVMRLTLFQNDIAASVEVGSFQLEGRIGAWARVLRTLRAPRADQLATSRPSWIT